MCLAEGFFFHPDVMLRDWIKIRSAKGGDVRLTVSINV